MAVSSVKGCVSAAQEGNSYSQNAELRWDNRSVKQGMKYQVRGSTLTQTCLTLVLLFNIKSQSVFMGCFQKGPRGMHLIQINVGLDKVSPAPCPSHTLLAKVQTNLRDHLEHMVQLGLCPPQPVSPHTLMTLDSV